MIRPTLVADAPLSCSETETVDRNRSEIVHRNKTADTDDNFATGEHYAKINNCDFVRSPSIR